MNKPKYLPLLLIILLSFPIFCQNQVDENHSKISTILDNYFDLEREAIHIHLNKTTFINNETIWYQGYIINRKTNKPYFTTNVFVVLYDEKGKQVSEKLVYAINGAFTGKIELGPKLESGNYYIQVYTNWMNNFSENESTITKITVINSAQGLPNNKKVNSESLEIFLNPEGKSLVSEISNTIGIQVKDCRGNSAENLEANIQNSSGEVLKTIKLNRFGFGKFEITPTTETIKVSVNFDNKIIEKILPKSESIGITVETNTFSTENKTAIKIKTNKLSYNSFQSKKLSLIIHQDQKFIVSPIQFKSDELEQTFIINNRDLHEGINVVRIIDNDMKQWAERLIYIKTSSTSDFNILKNNRYSDKINLVGYSQFPNSIMSISILPEDTKSIDGDNSIIAGITINPYLVKPLSNANYYLNTTNRLKFYELDLALLNEESKYNWNYMKVNVPVSNYSFDVGLNLKGKIDATIKNKTYHKVKMVAYKDRIMLSADVSENGDYEFERLLLSDSSLVKLSLEKLPNFENVSSNLYPKILNRKKVFNKPITDFIGQNCMEAVINETISDLDLPKLNSNIVKLEEVVVKKKKPELKYQKMLSNSMLRGYKIDETNHGDVLSFIETHGFRVRRSMGDVFILTRSSYSLNGNNPTPMVYIDDRPLTFSYNELDGMRMSDVDEIYIDSNAIGNSINNSAGIIKIYAKKLKNVFFENPDPNSFFVKEAYSVYFPFKNSDYMNTQSKGFDNYGTMGWSPRIIADESGDFMFNFTNYNKSKCKIVIEGITPDGKLFHEEKIIALK